MKKILILIIAIVSFISNAQNVGVISNTEFSDTGYTLFTLHQKTYLINNCGEVINEWTSTYLPGNAVYLLENGNLLRCGRTNSNNITFGGVGGRIELFDWDGNLLWGIFIDDINIRQHHDVFPLPNGNILVLAAEVVNQNDAINLGRDPNLLVDGRLFSEKIIEIEPVGVDQYNVIWEWTVIDHVVQDIDATKSNFNNVGLNEQLLDINFLNGLSGNENWLHVNSIQYNANLDQIILSSRNLSEIYIIDHSTTTAEAATNIGGNSGKGGDFLYRWGNPQSYRQGTEMDRKLYGQHYPHWIQNGFTDENKIILFNNGFLRTPSFSEVFIINPPINTLNNYAYVDNTAYLPIQPDYIYTNSNNFYSSIVSSAQRLQNGNTLICEGRTGEIFEIDVNENIVWEYVTPINTNDGTVFSPSETPVNNLTFRAIKYATDYPAFTNRTLTPGDPIENNPNISNCNALSITENQFNENDVKLYPNPVIDYLTVDYNKNIDLIEIYSISGQLIKQVVNTKTISFNNITSGLYILKIRSGNAFLTKKILKE